MKKQYDRSRLPKWAREELELLERRVEERDRKIEELVAAEPSHVELDPYGISDDEPKRYVPDTTRVRFTFGDLEAGWRNFIDARLEDGKLCIQAERVVHITPWSTNMLYIELGER